MQRIHSSASAVIDAPASRIYAVLADYGDGHPRVLPPRYFVGLDVEQGGTGAGTVIRVHTRAFGRIHTMTMDVTEPEPGRVLAETDRDTGLITTFTVDPLAGATQSQVTIATTWTPRGFTGLLQRWLVPPLMRRIYAEELRNLSQYAAQTTCE